MAKNNPNVKLIAIETSGSHLSLAAATLQSQADVKGELSLEVGTRHSEILKEAFAFLLDKMLWKKEELTHLAVSTGPGSFTGLRVGISFARALAQVLRLPLIGIPTFEVIAQGFEENRERSLYVLIPSIGDEVFVGRFKRARARPHQPYEFLSIKNLTKELRSKGPVILAGEGAARYEKELRQDLRDATIVSGGKNQPCARHLAQLALTDEHFKSAAVNSWKEVVPFYLRPPLAVERMKLKAKGSRS